MAAVDVPYRAGVEIVVKVRPFLGGGVLPVLVHHVGLAVELIAGDVGALVQGDHQTAELVAHFQAAAIDSILNFFALYAHEDRSFLITNIKTRLLPGGRNPF